MSNAGRPNEEIGWSRKAYVLGREGVCIELESDLFRIDMAAEGRGKIILTRALQLVAGTMKLLGDPRPTLTSFLLRNGRKIFFLHLSSFSLPRFDAPSESLFTSFIL